MNKKSKEPLMRIVRRGESNALRAWIIRIVCVLCALVACAFLIYGITKLNPIKVYVSMFQGAFGTVKRSWVTIRDTMMLLCIGIGLAPAFRMRFWNVGAEGQVLVGGICTAACMIYFGKSMSTPLLFLVMVVSSMAAGAIFGLIPALFKAKWNTNETLFTLMLNYIAIQLTSFCVSKWENPFGSNSVGIINQISRKGWFPSIAGQPYLLNVIIVMALTIGMFVYLRYSKHGYEIAVVGESRETARYAGISIGRVYIRTMLLSGAICGLAGFIAVSGASHTISTSTAGGRGFTAIIVAGLAKFNSFAMVLSAALLVFHEKGAMEIASTYNLNDYASQMITGIILFFILASEFFINYRIVFRGKEAK